MQRPGHPLFTDEETEGEAAVPWSPSNSAEHSSLIAGPALPGSGQQLLAGPAAGWAGTGLAQGRKVVGREIAGQLGGFCRASDPFPLKSPLPVVWFSF